MQVEGARFTLTGEPVSPLFALRRALRRSGVLRQLFRERVRRVRPARSPLVRVERRRPGRPPAAEGFENPERNGMQSRAVAGELELVGGVAQKCQHKDAVPHASA